MARRVFFSFHYDNDVDRSMIVRNSWVIRGVSDAGFIDKADFEKLKLKGDKAVRQWIDEQMKGTSVTVVLLGSETLSRPFVQYEICQSIKRDNGIIGVHINLLHDLRQRISPPSPVHTIIGYYQSPHRPVFFDEIADGIYDYVNDDGYRHLGMWIEAAALRHGR